MTLIKLIRAALPLIFLMTADAAPVTFTYLVNTGGINGTAGYLDFQFNAGSIFSQPATATISEFSTAGGALTAPSINTGSASGSLPGNVTLGNNAAFNDTFQPFTFGSTFRFTITLSGPALDTPAGSGSGTAFGLSLYGADAVTPLLTLDPNGTILVLQLNPNGTTQASSASVVSAVAVPEPASWVLLIGAALAFALSRRLLNASSLN